MITEKVQQFENSNKVANSLNVDQEGGEIQESEMTS